jgi:threonine dehydratase
MTTRQRTVTLTHEDVERAADRLRERATKTPILTSRTANAATKSSLYFKCENFQRTGSFKFRGAYNAIASLDQKQRERGVVAFSSGNHAQAIALAGYLLSAPTVVVMPKDAPEIKVTATRDYGGRIVAYDRYTEDREFIAQRLAEEHGMALIPSYDHPDVIAGQGTAAKEFCEVIEGIDKFFVPLGGGGLLAGTALAIKALSPTTKIFGVEPEAGNDGQRSFREGRIVRIPVPKSIADGAIVTHLGDHTFPIIRELVHDIVTVPEIALIECMKFFAERMKLIVEPTGCLAAAAALSNAYHLPGERLGVLVSGGNVDLSRFARLVA